MEHFLELTARDLYDNFSDPVKGLSHITAVFPNRRARLFFDDYLSQSSGKPIWSPEYVTIEELFQSHSTLEAADQFKLISILYSIYRKELQSDETADSFWSWGELMLRDFDDIDRNMADADGIFSCLRSQKELTDNSFLDERQTEILKNFFSSFKSGKTKLQERYCQIWSALGPIYDKFRSTLLSQGAAYDGMIQREVASSPDTDSFGDRIYAFIGFNSLNKAEKMLFRALRDSGKAIFYWDYDREYIEDDTQEAGLFMRENLIEFPNRISDEHFDNIRSEKKLTIVETSSDNAQARYIPRWLEESDEKQKPDKDTAIVLCDSGLLQPVLHSIGHENTGDVNITMGFPLSSIPLYGFVTALLDIQRISLKNSGRLTIEHIGKILNNPLTERISPRAAELYRTLRDSHRYCPDIAEITEGDDALKAIFAPCADHISMLDNLLAVFRLLAPTLSADSDDTLFQPLYSEALYRCYTQVSRFRTLIEEGTLDISTEMLCALLRKVMGTTNIPFHGEPAIGMQILGMIETRNLDFRNILLLSSSEGTLPATGSEASFIPYSLREAFGLTTMKEKSAVAAYNFYHLLQRAENVTMVYNSNADASGAGKGQMSRYLLQLILSGRKIRRIMLQPHHSEQSSSGGITIAKDDESMRRLYRMYDFSNEKSYISPSALNCYLDCHLKYYLKYVAGIGVKDDDPVEINASQFGTLFHTSAELAYNHLASCGKDNVITREMLDDALKNHALTESFVRESFKKELFDGKEVAPEDYNGVQSVNFEVIHRYLLQMIRMDRQYAPFTYIGSEAQDFSHFITIPHPEKPGEKLRIRISGRIDRMDCKDGIYRIADYKTGHVEEEPKSMDNLFEEKASRRKYALQTFYYATLVHNKPGYEERKLAPVLLYLRSSASPSEDSIYMKMNGEPVTDFAGKYLDDYESRLQETVSEIFNKDVAFTQTKLISNCKYCDFKNICRRKSGDEE